MGPICSLTATSRSNSGKCSEAGREDQGSLEVVEHPEGRGTAPTTNTIGARSDAYLDNVLEN